MSKQPEALRLAEILDSFHDADEVQPMAAELRRLHHENELLQQKLAEAITPNYFWDAENAERGHDSMHNAIVDIMESGFFSVGDEIELQQARFLPNVTVRITAVDDDDGGELAYEESSAIAKAEGGEA